MPLRFEKVTESNKAAVLSLRLHSFQKGYTESIEESLEEAGKHPEWQPCAVYHGEELVGFTMYGYFAEDSELWIDTIVIDRFYQGKGYGRKLLEQLLELLAERYLRKPVYLSVFSDNHSAIYLYQNLGFQFNGRLDTKGEQIMVYTFED
ncbi:GNAT family N-acetyltransferase [Streptococcus hyointestinalis]|uniref:GNAT family N-acetyltransferase n=1 Tax=Streptococcus hyointestinalis TaxID=1337 RepID=UPI0013DF6EE4|nr:GNAT family N-acetyltransferase [Streptococcus hyointestinalis]